MTRIISILTIVFVLTTSTSVKIETKTGGYDWTKIKEFKFYGFENPNDVKNASYILADTDKIKSILLNVKRSEGFLPKGATRFATITFDNKKQITIQLISGRHLPFRVIKKNLLTDKWFDFDDKSAASWTNYINELIVQMEK